MKDEVLHSISDLLKRDVSEIVWYVKRSAENSRSLPEARLRFQKNVLCRQLVHDYAKTLNLKKNIRYFSIEEAGSLGSASFKNL